MSNEWLFLGQVGVAAVVSLTVILYLRSILRGMLLEICDRQPLRAEFWVRMLDVMMLVAPMILTLLLGLDGGSVFAALRRALLLVLIGQFVSLVVVARTIWGFVQPPPLPRAMP